LFPCFHVLRGWKRGNKLNYQTIMKKNGNKRRKSP